MFGCKICNASVKDLSHHLDRTHSIAEKEYADLVTDEVDAFLALILFQHLAYECSLDVSLD